jgi:hypothetical protein
VPLKPQLVASIFSEKSAGMRKLISVSKGSNIAALVAKKVDFFKKVLRSIREKGLVWLIMCRKNPEFSQEKIRDFFSELSAYWNNFS